MDVAPTRGRLNVPFARLCGEVSALSRMKDAPAARGRPDRLGEVLEVVRRDFGCNPLLSLDGCGRVTDECVRSESVGYSPATRNRTLWSRGDGHTGHLLATDVFAAVLTFRHLPSLL